MPSLRERVAGLDWTKFESELNDRGYALTGRILDASECDELISLYPDRSRFRSRVDMARLRYGVGEYKYLAYPLPDPVSELRRALYERLAPIANRWSRMLGDGDRYPRTLDGFLRTCRAHDQVKPTPLILRYESGGYNCLHQDLYGQIAFPLQFTFVLSQRGTDYQGGESLLVEQRPRAQSRGEVIGLAAGHGMVFPNRYRPVPGARRNYRVNVRHGVSTITSGTRYALGIIFHDAK